MKKFLVVLLSLGLIAVFAATASAVDVKFAGEYYIAGGYNNNPTLAKDVGYSRAAFRQRWRFMPTFKFEDGLSFTTRADILEKTWGSTKWSGATSTDGDKNSSRKEVPSNAAVKTQENVEFEYSYVTFKTAVGQLEVGYQNCDGWGTAFSNASSSRPAIKYTTALGPLTLGAAYEKWIEADVNGTLAKTLVDGDADTYAVFGIYKWKGGEAGLLYKYYYDATNKATATPYKTLVSQLAPYAKAKFGPVFVEAEVDYFFGKAAKFDDNAGTDVDAATLTYFIHGQMNMGPAYFGAHYAFASGNDPNEPTKSKEMLGMNTSYQPTILIGGGDALNDIGDMCKLGGVNGTTGMDDHKWNLIFYNIYAGFNPTPKLNVEVELTYATVAEKPANYISDKVGTELGLKASYKIYDNLSYLVEAAYLWTGDYWKGTSAANSVDNTYVLLNKLSLQF